MKKSMNEISLNIFEKYWVDTQKIRPDLFLNRNRSKRDEIVSIIYNSWKSDYFKKTYKHLNDEEERYLAESNFHGFEEFEFIRELVNNKDCEYIVYIWYIKSNSKDNIDIPFYVGKGKKNRNNNLISRSDGFKYIYEKYECYSKIIKDNLTEVDALRLESKMILELTRLGFPLINKKIQDPRMIL